MSPSELFLLPFHDGILAALLRTGDRLSLLESPARDIHHDMAYDPGFDLSGVALSFK